MEFNNILRKVTLMFIFPIIYYLCYLLWGIIISLAITFILLVIKIIINTKNKNKITNIEIINILGLIISIICCLFTKNSKYYFLSSIINNTLILLFMIYLIIFEDGIIKFGFKNINEKIEKIKNKKLFIIEILWILFFILKISIKLLGIFKLDFSCLYWVNWIIGNPITLLLIFFTIIYIKYLLKKVKLEND